MDIPLDLQNRIIGFLNINPHLQRENERRAVVRLAGLDDNLMGQIEFTGSTLAFLPLLIEALVTYGTLSDGRDALEAFLTAVEQIVGESGQETLEGFIREWRALPKKTGLKPHNMDTYLRYIVDMWENVESPLLPPDVSLAKVAAHLKIVDIGSDPKGSKKPKLPGYSKKILTDSHLKSAELGVYLENNPANERWIILGDPGTGKTTLLLFEAHRLAQNALDDPQKVIPAWIPLASFNSQVEKNFNYSIYDYLGAIGQSLALTNAGKRFRELATEGRVIFLLDGLDEVLDASRRSLCERIHASIPSGIGNRIVYTSRKVGFSGLPGFVILEIESLTVDQQRQLMIAICGEEKTALLLRNIAGARYLQDMAAVPIALTVLALVAREGEDNLTDFLQRNTDLFRFGSEILLEGRHRGNVGVLNPENAELILARASLNLHGSREGSQGDETFAATKVESAVMAADRAWLLPWQGPRHFIKDVASHSSLIYPTDTLNQHYRYLHRTFREYFAALELSRLSQDERQRLIRQVLNQQQWAEVLVLLGGLTPDVEGYLNQLLSGPPDLALRTLKEVKKLDPKLAAEVLQLKPGNLKERRQVFITLSRKLRSPEQTVRVLRAYLEAAKAEVPRADLYFIQEVLWQYDLDIARDLLKALFKYLPRIPEGLIDSVTIQGEELPYFCDVPAGPFLLGGARDDPARPSWVSIHTEVYVSSFQIGRVPVTNLVYEVFNPEHKKIRDFQDEVPPEELDHHPAVRVSWYEAEIFCQWLAQAVSGIRLPTEAEWEKAASWSSGNKKRRFPWGDDWEPSLLNSWQSGPNRTTRVGSYLEGKSPCGALDMAGNVWEWCSDWFEDDLQSYFDILRQTPKDPRGPTTGTRRVDRGGGWYHDVGLPFTFLRAADDPADDFSHCGFRLAHSIPTP